MYDVFRLTILPLRDWNAYVVELFLANTNLKAFIHPVLSAVYIIAWKIPIMYCTALLLDICTQFIDSDCSLIVFNCAFILYLEVAICVIKQMFLYLENLEFYNFGYSLIYWAHFFSLPSIQFFIVRLHLDFPSLRYSFWENPYTVAVLLGWMRNKY